MLDRQSKLLWFRRIDPCCIMCFKMLVSIPAFQNTGFNHLAIVQLANWLMGFQKTKKSPLFLIGSGIFRSCMINFLTSNPLSSNSLYIDLPGFMPTFGILVSWTVKTQFSLGKLACISDLNGIAPMTYRLMIMLQG